MALLAGMSVGSYECVVASVGFEWDAGMGKGGGGVGAGERGGQGGGILRGGFG